MVRNASNVQDEYRRRAAKALSEIQRLSITIRQKTREALRSVGNSHVSAKQKQMVSAQERRVLKKGGTTNRPARARKPRAKVSAAKALLAVKARAHHKAVVTIHPAVNPAEHRRMVYHAKRAKAYANKAGIRLPVFLDAVAKSEYIKPTTRYSSKEQIHAKRKAGRHVQAAQNATNARNRRHHAKAAIQLHENHGLPITPVMKKLLKPGYVDERAPRKKAPARKSRLTKRNGPKKAEASKAKPRQNKNNSGGGVTKLPRQLTPEQEFAWTRSKRLYQTALAHLATGRKDLAFAYSDEAAETLKHYGLPVPQSLKDLVKATEP